MEKIEKYGQYFTTNYKLKEKLISFILNKPDIILEPCIGRGDLVISILEVMPNVIIDMFEIDNTITLLDKVKSSENIKYVDFLKHIINKKYKTIIGNPPYVKIKKGRGNLYIEFIEKCYNLLDDGGELIFIVPANFFKLTHSSKLLIEMIQYGNFTHIYHPHNEKLFQNATIDVLIFRYCHGNKTNEILYNDKLMYVNNSDGIITFNINKETTASLIKDYFNLYVGMVSGRDKIYKNKTLGNIQVLTSEDKIEKFVCLLEFPCTDNKINKYLLKHKEELLSRKIRNFNENNWFEWGALRNFDTINEELGRDCIYIHTLTRKDKVAFVGTVEYFGGGLIIMIPKKKCDLYKVVDYLNSFEFRNKFIFSGRFKIGHKQLSNSYFN